MPINLIDLFGHFPLTERSAVFILVCLYVHQTSTCGLGLCCAEDSKLIPTLESSIFVLCIALIASKYDWWPQKLTQVNGMKWLVNLIYNSWIALILTNLTENFFLVPLHHFTGLLADALSFGVVFIIGNESDASELPDKIGCMILWVLSIAFLIYTLTNDGGVCLFIEDLKTYIKELRDARQIKSVAFAGCISAAVSDESDEQEEEPARPQVSRQHRGGNKCRKNISPRRGCRSSCRHKD